MKALLNTSIFSALLPVVCVDDSVLLTLFELQFTHQSNSPNWVRLSEKESMSSETQFSDTEYIDLELCREIK